MDQELLSDTFVDLADTMVADFDVIDFLHLLSDRSVQLLGASAAGVMLADPRGQLRLVAASSEAVRLLEVFQLEGEEGPCLESIRTGQPVVGPDLRHAQQRWPRFTPAALQAGFTAVHALPMRLREQVLGGLNLFHHPPGPFDSADMDTAFTALRRYARDNNLRLSDLAQTFIDSDAADFPGLTQPAHPRQRQ